MKVRIVVADDHGVVREGQQPDVLIMDINFPDGSGLDATREVGRVAPNVAVLMLTMYDDDDSLFAAVRAGALGYVLKGADPEQIVRAISSVSSGEAIFGPGVARRAMTLLSTSRDAASPFPTLTPRELEILHLISTGIGNSAIAGQLCVSPNTVANHVSNIFRKLQVATRAEAIARARDAGLGAT